MKNIAKSLAKFHTLMGNVEKDANNPFFKSKYAPLETILPAIKQPLADAGLVFSQSPSHITSFTHISGADNYQAVPSLKTTLIDIESGEKIESEVPLILAKQDPQGVGSAITYMRRYALVAMLGLNCDEDDDGNKASNPSIKPKTALKQDLVAKTDQTTLKPYDAALKAIEEANNVDDLILIQKQISSSKKLTSEESEKLLFQVDEKIHSFDPTK